MTPDATTPPVDDARSASDAPLSGKRSVGQRFVARALWYVGPGIVELRPQTLAPLALDEARVRTTCSTISRGTERLVLAGKVPSTEHDRMRAPLQEGAFPFPVKYGYCAAGIVEAGPADWIGIPVFCLHPHQDAFNVPVSRLAKVPDGVPLSRATLAANMETALNAIWDGAVGPGDTVVVVGAGVVGLLVAALCAKFPGTDVYVVDPIAARAGLIATMGATSAQSAAGIEADVVFHTSATSGGLASAIEACGQEATLVEMSWYGATPVQANLGGAFHSRRLRLVSSQVGQVAPSHRPRWDYRRRLEKALHLLADTRYDALITESVAFSDLPTRLPALLAETTSLPPLIVYEPNR